MDSVHTRIRWISALLSILAMFGFATAAGAQGLFGAGLPGLPSFGGVGGTLGCSGEKLCRGTNLEAYVGYMGDRDGTSVNLDTAGLPPLGGTITSFQHRFTNKGVWVGLGDAIRLSDKLSFIASGWVLAPSTTDSREGYVLTGGEVFERSWDVKLKWWYVDGLFALGSPCNGLTLLAGLRYDYYGPSFKNPTYLVSGLPSDTADVISQSWIPLLGTQCAYSSHTGSLVVRAVGFPTLLGHVTYEETFGGAGTRYEDKGNYNNGYFLELFAEWSKNIGPGAVGIFGRWNSVQGNANVHVDHLVVGDDSGEAEYKLTLHRNSWTVGGSASLNFNLPL